MREQQQKKDSERRERGMERAKENREIIRKERRSYRETGRWGWGWGLGSEEGAAGLGIWADVLSSEMHQGEPAGIYNPNDKLLEPFLFSIKKIFADSIAEPHQLSREPGGRSSKIVRLQNSSQFCSFTAFFICSLTPLFFSAMPNYLCAKQCAGHTQGQMGNQSSRLPSGGGERWRSGYNGVGSVSEGGVCRVFRRPSGDRG